MGGHCASVPLFGRDCRVALCAPRNDKGSSQCTVHSPQFRSGTFAHGGVPVFGRDCRVALCAPRNDNGAFALLAMTGCNAVCTRPKQLSKVFGKSARKAFFQKGFLAPVQTPLKRPLKHSP
ncbi:MAG: hypothetical protein LBL66_01475 [Clostridiales bacterium]|nr:hypothetical protein [Clostridiales bacterium]